MLVRSVARILEYFMRTIITLTILLLFSSAYAETVTMGHIRNQQYPPYAWWSETEQRPIGYNQTLLHTLFNELRVELAHVTYESAHSYDLSAVFKALDKGAIDIYLLTEGMAKALTSVHIVPAPAAQIQIKVFVLKNKEFPFAQWSDLMGRRGLALRDPRTEILGTKDFDSYARKQLNISGSDSLETIIAALENGEADYIAVFYKPTLLYLRIHKKHKQIIALESPLSSTSVNLVISKKSPLLSRVDEINETLLKFKAEGRMNFWINQAMQRYVKEVQVSTPSNK